MCEALRSLATGQEILSYGVIARRLSDLFGLPVTRNAVIGKARRLGLPLRPQDSRGGVTLRRRSDNVISFARMRRVSAAILPEEVTTVEPLCKRTFEQLRMDRECHYPYGEHPNFMFCGDPKLEESSYCAYHHKLTRRLDRYSKERSDEKRVASNRS